MCIRDRSVTFLDQRDFAAFPVSGHFPYSVTPLAVFKVVRTPWQSFFPRRAQKCLETGETTKSLEYGKCLETGETTKSLENNEFWFYLFDIFDFDCYYFFLNFRYRHWRGPKQNKLASLEAMLVWNYDRLTYSLTKVKSRATSIAKNSIVDQYRYLKRYSRN